MRESSRSDHYSYKVYSDPAMAHLALAFAGIMGREMSDYLQERIFGPIGIELGFALRVRIGGLIRIQTGTHVIDPYVG